MSDVSNRTPPLNDGERDKSTDSGIVSSNRRRLLTGAAALPVIMTLPTNASATAFGSAMQCLDSQNKQPTDFFTMAPNGWATKPFKCIRVALPNGSDSHELGVYGYDKLFSRHGVRWYYDGSTDRYKPEGYWRGSGYKKVGDGSGYTYIYVAQNGTYMGTDPRYRSMGGLAVYGSCYVSIVGMR